jgi:hypothetical protein
VVVQAKWAIVASGIAGLVCLVPAVADSHWTAVNSEF